jgi:hypothetical protein
MRRVLRLPALHYLVLGAVLCAARATVVASWSELPAALGGRPRIVITAGQREQVQRDFQATRGRRAAPEEERPHLERLVEDEILYREALARGLDRDNVVVRDRVVQSMRLLAEDPDADEESLYAKARQIGLDRRDLVVHRHLATMMRLLAAAPARAEAISDGDLEDLLARERDRFRLAATTSLTQVFVSDAPGRAPAEAAARGLLDALRTVQVDPADAPARGDPFPPGYRLMHRTDGDLDALFGAGFASAVARLPLESWQGPIRSSYGFHLVWVHARSPGGVPTLDAVRTRLVERLRHDRGERRLHEWLAERRKAYDVEVEDAGVPAPAMRAIAAPPAAFAPPRPAVFVGD